MSDPLNKEAERLVTALRDAARRAGLNRHDPMAPLVLAFIETIKFLSDRTALSDRIATDASRRIARTVSQSRHAADAETKRFQAALAKTEAETVGRVATAIIETADAAWTRRVRIFDRNTAMLAAFILFAVASASLAGGAWWGHSRAYAGFRETEAALHTAFLDGPDTAYEWSRLMLWNDLRGPIAACASPGRTHVQGGRRFCVFPLWTEKPPDHSPPRP